MPLYTHLYAAQWLLPSTLLVLYVTYKYYRYKRLSAFKGPLTTGWSELWHMRLMLGTHRHLAYKNLNEKYGPIARIGPNDLITSSPELLVHMSAVRSPYTRSAWFYSSTRIVPGKDHVASELDEEKHTKRRQQMAAGYSGKENIALESDIDSCVEQLLSLLRNKYSSTNDMAIPVDLGRKIQYLTLDVISKVGFGQAFGNLEADADVDDYISSSEQGLMVISTIAALGLVSLLQWPPIARLLGPSEKDKTGLGKMMGLARKRINSRLEKPMDGYSDMLASFHRHGLSRDDLFVESVIQITAGSDTSATGIRSIMLYLIAHPRVYRKLQAEIDNAVALGTIAAGAIAQDSSLRKLPYLQAVIREGVRMHPPIASVIPKLVPKGGDTVTVEGTSYFLPGGTHVSYNAWGVHRNKAVFGDDADQFRPERWLMEEMDGEKMAAMRRTTELVFGYGKYQCLGKSIAWMEMSKTIFEFLRHFDWALATPEMPWNSNNYNGLFTQKHMWVTVTRRKC